MEEESSINCKRKDRFRESQVIPTRRREFIINGNKIIYASLDALIGFVCEPCSDIATREAFIYTFRCYADQNLVLNRFLELYQKHNDQRNVIINNMIQFMSKVMTTSDKETISLVKNIIQLHRSIDSNAANYLELLLTKTQTKIILPPTTADVTLTQMIFTDNLFKTNFVSHPLMSTDSIHIDNGVSIPSYFINSSPNSPYLKSSPKKTSFLIGKKTSKLNESSILNTEPYTKVNEVIENNKQNEDINVQQIQSKVTTTEEDQQVLKEIEFNFLNIPAIVFAKQVTLIEYDLFMKIHISELYSWNNSNRENTASNIIKFLQHRNKMEHWYVQLILLAPPNQRLGILKRIIEVGIRMNDLNNWNGLVEVATALDSFPIYRLEHLFLQLNENDKENFRQIKSYGSIDSLLMNDSNMIPGACIPYVNTYLRKIVEINKNAQPSIQSGGFVLINVEKCRQLAHYIVDWVQCQKYPYLFGHNQAMQEWIESHLVKINCNEENEYQLSIQIEKEHRKTMVFNNEIHLLKYNTNCVYTHPQIIPCNTNMLVGDFLKFNYADGIFMLSPNPKQPNGQIINISETIGKVFQTTKDLRNEDTIFSLVKDITQVKVWCFEYHNHKDTIHYSTLCLDATQPVIQNIIIIKQFYGIEDIQEDEFYEEKYAILYRNSNKDRFNFLSPFAKNLMKTGGELVLIPSRFMQPSLSQLEVSIKSQVVYMNEVECFSSFVNVQLRSYKMIICEGFLFFYSSKETFVVALGYYKIKLYYDSIKDKAMILLVESTDSKENPMIVMVPECQNLLSGCIKLSNQIAPFCTASIKTHCFGVDSDKLISNPIPQPYEVLMNSVFTSDNLTLNKDFFDLNVQPKRWTEAMYYLEEGITSSEPVVNSQLLLLLLKLHPTPFIPITFHSQIKEKYKKFYEIEMSGNENDIIEAKKDKEAYMKRVLSTMSYNKQVIIIGMCKIFDIWADGKVSRLESIKNIVDNALIKDHIEGVEIIHDIAHLNTTINKIDNIHTEYQWQVSIFNNAQRKILDELLGFLQHSMITNSISLMKVNKTDKFELLHSNILMLKDDKFWKESIANIILKGGFDNQPIDEVSKEMTVELSVVEDYNAFKAFALNLECRNNAKSNYINLTQKHLKNKSILLKETRDRCTTSSDQPSFLRLLLNRRNQVMVFP
ncbi:hypothetical protein ENUP19_0010G0017 [Entamoeba nuttalli]|uniref:Ras guanine nucleotide exchange factor, putative n=2 Tax=Entamoeba nuttalli TaxID=412467 RepID=K2GI35_ENTNP|nr:Ras guanine nucleotide exchange factor, putative [Entamoeba nuttalli P19]EKE42441.1 Ras guanine nucleotide exchange factor, putative [Entamoeba nuttalli P19]|eukprot:XP_008855222.1 Ras guanine nucleotide exchange factor, putative [Entamoeba nuttalli P19]